MENKDYKTVTVSIPFSEEELDEYFEDIDKYNFIIDYDKCKYKGRILLNYIHNSGMHCEIKFNAMSDDVAVLLDEYLKLKYTVSVPVLNDIWCDIMNGYTAKKFESEEPGYQEFVMSFIKNHEEEVQELAQLLSSLKLHLTEIAMTGEGKIDAPDADLQYVGENFISLRMSDRFWAMIGSLNDQGIKNFSILSKFCYEGRRLSGIFMNEFNPFSFCAVMRMENKGADENNEDKG